MFDLILRGAQVVNASGIARADVAISQGRIAAVLLPGQPAPSVLERRVDGCLLLPGLVDAHVHLCDPGLTHKEDFLSGTRAAAAGGVTTVLDMPTDEPWTASAEDLRQKSKLAEGRIYTDVGLQIAVQHDGQHLDQLQALEPVSFEVFTAWAPERFLHDTQERLVRTLQRLSERNVLACVSPGDHSIQSRTAGTYDPDPNRSDVDAFLICRPPIAEATGITRTLLAAAATRARVHVRQANSGLSLQAWRRLKDLADVTLEATPQSLLFSETDYPQHGNYLKCAPPMRSPEDVELLRSALRDGLIDMMVTDHSPHSHLEKDPANVSFAQAPLGIPGVQTLLFAMLHLVHRGDIDLPALVRLCAWNPAGRFGLAGKKGALDVGHDADILILDPAMNTTVRNADQLSKSGYTPFDGLNVPWGLREVLLRGKTLSVTGAAPDGPPLGRVIG